MSKFDDGRPAFPVPLNQGEPLTEEELAEVSAWAAENTAGLTSALIKPSAARFRGLDPKFKRR